MIWFVVFRVTKQMFGLNASDSDIFELLLLLFFMWVYLKN